MLSAVGVSALPVTEVVAADVDELSRHSRDDSSTRSSSCESIDSFDCSPCQVVHIGECDVGCQTSAPECDESAACQTDVTMMNHMLVSVHDWRLLPSSTHMVDASSQTDSLVCFDQAEFAAVEKQFVGAMKDAAAKNSELAGALAKYEEIADRQAETIAQLSVAKPSHQASQMPHIARVQRLTAPRRSKR